MIVQLNIIVFSCIEFCNACPWHLFDFVVPRGNSFTTSYPIELQYYGNANEFVKWSTDDKICYIKNDKNIIGFLRCLQVTIAQITCTDASGSNSKKLRINNGDGYYIWYLSPNLKRSDDQKVRIYGIWIIDPLKADEMEINLSAIYPSRTSISITIEFNNTGVRPYFTNKNFIAMRKTTKNDEHFKLFEDSLIEDKFIIKFNNQKFFWEVIHYNNLEYNFYGQSLMLIGELIYHGGSFVRPSDIELHFDSIAPNDPSWFDVIPTMPIIYYKMESCEDEIWAITFNNKIYLAYDLYSKFQVLQTPIKNLKIYDIKIIHKNRNMYSDKTEKLFFGYMAYHIIVMTSNTKLHVILFYKNDKHILEKKYFEINFPDLTGNINVDASIYCQEQNVEYFLFWNEDTIIITDYEFKYKETDIFKVKEILNFKFQLVAIHLQSSAGYITFVYKHVAKQKLLIGKYFFNNDFHLYDMEIDIKKSYDPFYYDLIYPSIDNKYFYIFDSHSIIKISENYDEKITEMDDPIFEMILNKFGEILIHMSNGSVFLYLMESDIFYQIHQLMLNEDQFCRFDSQSNLWILTYVNSSDSFSRKKIDLKRYIFELGEDESICEIKYLNIQKNVPNGINQYYLDYKQMWIFGIDLVAVIKDKNHISEDQYLKFDIQNSNESIININKTSTISGINIEKNLIQFYINITTSVNKNYTSYYKSSELYLPNMSAEISMSPINLQHKHLKCFYHNSLYAHIKLGCRPDLKIEIMNDRYIDSKGNCKTNSDTLISIKSSYRHHLNGSRLPSIKTYYNMTMYGCPIVVPIPSSSLLNLKLDQVLAGNQRSRINDNTPFVLYEIYGQKFKYYTDSYQACCKMQPQTWSKMWNEYSQNHSNWDGNILDIWNQINYRECQIENTGALLKGSIPYEILNSSSNISFYYNGYYFFELIILDPKFSFCNVTTRFSVYVDGINLTGNEFFNHSFFIFISIILITFILLYVYFSKFVHQKIN